MKDYNALERIRSDAGEVISRAFDVGYQQGYEDGVNRLDTTYSNLNDGNKENEITKTEAIQWIKTDISRLPNSPSQNEHKKVLEMAIKALDNNWNILQNIKSEIKELTKCPYGKCIGDHCANTNDCMLQGDHIIEIIDKYCSSTCSDIETV